MTEYTLELFRSSDLDEHGCVQGTMWLKKRNAGIEMFVTREKGHGYARLRPGTYVMERSHLSHFPDVACFAPTENLPPKQKNCFIHPITRHVKPPDNAQVALAGCIAPFVYGRPEQGGSSDLAMNRILQLTGAAKEGAHITLVVQNDVPAAAL